MTFRDHRDTAHTSRRPVRPSVRPFLRSFLQLVHETLASVTSEIYSRTQRILTNWDAKQPDMQKILIIGLKKIGYIGGLKLEKILQTAVLDYIFIYIQIIQQCTILSLKPVIHQQMHW
jgi:hypothetical protein